MDFGSEVEVNVDIVLYLGGSATIWSCAEGGSGREDFFNYLISEEGEWRSPCHFLHGPA